MGPFSTGVFLYEYNNCIGLFDKIEVNYHSLFQFCIFQPPPLEDESDLSLE